MDPRVKTLIQLVAMAAVGGLIYWRLPGHRAGAYVVWSLAVVFTICGFFIPPAHRAIDRFFFATLPRVVAAALNWLLLVPFFYLVFAPARFFLALSGRDPMTRRVPTDAKTYWIPRKPVPGPEQYKKQH